MTKYKCGSCSWEGTETDMGLCPKCSRDSLDVIGDKIVVFTAGTWDLFHVGHLNIIEKSKEYGDYLIVAVSTDELVESYKHMRPFIPYEERFRIIKALKCVDKVVKQTILHDINMLKKYKIDVTTIGSDWKTKHLDGLEWMEKNGKKVIYLPYTQGISSGKLRERICREWVKKNGKK